ncbi:MAG: PhnD/SsuA/transferrin family substrate-binding protein [Euryarchaeota archaeon]|jgi:ABC-type phosphate/phosphonate transport system substrate-binding protein|nr:PhnD/SsuA/transferrin family substrate-binding protein [Euryarchaeota archaeon]MBT5453680.1 PhnD/SsuA/transferrin family substrate-binding protein [Euryarchaeota archaeon]
MKTRTLKSTILVFLIATASLAGCLGSEDENESSNLEDFVIAYSIKDDYTNVDENPQRLADYMREELNMDVSLYPIDSEGAALQALRFGNADIAFMDGGAAWVGWQQYGLDAIAADQKSDGRTYYSAHAVVLKDSEIAAAHLDDDPATDPFSLMAGKNSCHTGWLKSAGMLLPMGFLIGNGYANVIGDANDVESLRSTITNFFSEDSSIPDSGTPYYSYSGAVKCLSEGAGDVAFVKDSTVPSYCGNDDASTNEAWCLPESDYILLPSYGNAPSHPVMYNPATSDAATMTLVQEALVAMKDTPEGLSILTDVLNTPAISSTNASQHLASYGNLIEDVPGISAYYDTKFTINDSVEPTISNIRIAFEMKDDYENPAENPQVLADFIAEQTGVTVTLYPVTSEGAIIEALRFGNADIAFMDGGAAWVGWKEYGLAAMAADLKSDGRTHYDAHAVVLNGSDIANAYLDDDASTDPFAMMEGKTSCHTGWLKSAGMLLPMGHLISQGYAPVVGPQDDIESLRNTITSFFNENASIPESGTPYYSYSGAVKCLTEGVGDVAFAKDSTVASYCGNEEVSDNADWCLPESEYILLPSYGSAPSHPVMYNPATLDVQTRTAILNAMLALNTEMYVEDYPMQGQNFTGCYSMVSHQVDSTSPQSACGDQILSNVLNTPGLVEVNSQEHLGSYSSLISAIPGISTYFDSKYDIEE